MLICPVCKSLLTQHEKSYVCKNKHSFDIAKEGYVNLLCSHRSGDTVGDNKLMARARSALLNKGYYISLADALCKLLTECGARNVLDICCGEGWYTDHLSKHTAAKFYGFDLSREMIRLAAKRGGDNVYFVANLASIPVQDGAFDAAIHLFAPINASEFRRVVKAGGKLYSVMPGAYHLFGMKKVLYEHPYLNDETPQSLSGFNLMRTVRVRDSVTLVCHDDIKALFEMTPYLYRTPREGIDRLMALDTLTTEVEFLINVYE